MLIWGNNTSQLYSTIQSRETPRPVVHLQHFSNLLCALKTWNTTRDSPLQANDCFQKSTACHSNAALN